MNDMRLVRALALCVLTGCVGICSAAVEAEDRLVLVAGGGTGTADVPATKAKLDGPFGVDFNAAGEAFLVEISGHHVFKIDAQGVLRHIGGTGAKGNSGDGGPAAQATFNAMHAVAVDAAGHILVADTLNNRVRKIDATTGIITAFAGTGAKGDKADGIPAVEAVVGAIYCIAFNPDKTKLLLTDLDDRKIRAVDLKTGLISTVAGNGQKGIPVDGAVATEAPLVDPRAACADAAGNIYILERGGHALRVVNPAGKIRTLIGNGKAGSVGDGGEAKSAQLNGPKHLCLDREGGLLIADTENHVIRRYTPQDGKIERLAGTGKKGATGVGGPPLQAELFQPHGVVVDAHGTLYISDSGNHRVLKIERAKR